jgi:hypothetical protein
MFNTPFVVGRSLIAGAPVREMPRLSIARPGDGGQPERPTRSVRVRRSGPLAPEETPVTQDETVIGGTKVKPGRTYRIRGYSRP